MQSSLPSIARAGLSESSGSGMAVFDYPLQCRLVNGVGLGACVVIYNVIAGGVFAASSTRIAGGVPLLIYSNRIRSAPRLVNKLAVKGLAIWTVNSAVLIP